MANQIPALLKRMAARESVSPGSVADSTQQQMNSAFKNIPLLGAAITSKLDELKQTIVQQQAITQAGHEMASESLVQLKSIDSRMGTMNVVLSAILDQVGLSAHIDRKMLDSQLASEEARKRAEREGEMEKPQLVSKETSRGGETLKVSAIAGIAAVMTSLGLDKLYNAFKLVQDMVRTAVNTVQGIVRLFSKADKVAETVAAAGRGIEKGEKAAVETVSIISKIGTKFSVVTSFFGKILGFFSSFGIEMKAFGGIIGKVFGVASGGLKAVPFLRPIFMVIDAFTGFMEGYRQGGIVEGIIGAIKGVVEGLVTLPLDLLKEIASWAAKKMGFDEASEWLDSFSITDIFEKVVFAIRDHIAGWLEKLQNVLGKTIVSDSLVETVRGPKPKERDSGGNVKKEPKASAAPSAVATSQPAAGVVSPTLGASAGAPTGGEKGGKADSGSEKQAMDFFVGRGWTKEQAAGIVGNLIAESNLRTNAEGDNGKAYGIAQWHPDRQAEFKKTIGKDIRDSSFIEQLAFVDFELHNKEKKAGAALAKAKDAAEAAAIFDQMYERSSGQHRQKRMVTAARLAGGKVSEVAAAPVQSSASSGAKVSQASTGVDAAKQQAMKPPAPQQPVINVAGGQGSQPGQGGVPIPSPEPPIIASDIFNQLFYGAA